jgi:hypothetical protein
MAVSVPPALPGTVQFPGVHCLPKRALLAASLGRGEAGCAGKSVLRVRTKSRKATGSGLRPRGVSMNGSPATSACRSMMAKQSWPRFNGTSSSSSVPSMFCSDVIARGVAERGHRYRNGLAISSSRAEGCVDDIGNTRMGKQRRMRWSPHGAHRVAVTRAAVLDGRLTVSKIAA